MIDNNSMKYCRVCDSWYYIELNHVHPIMTLDDFVKSLSVTTEGVCISISANRKEFSLTCIPRITGIGANARYRRQILHETSKKVNFYTLQDALNLMMEFLYYE